jgi:exosortase/archaeosortase family protein
MLTRLFILGQLVAYWPVWRWYGERMQDGSDEPWGILAFITAIILVLRKGTWNVPSTLTMMISTGIVALYAISYGYLPPLLRGVLMVVALSFSVSSICYGRTVHAGIVGLMLLSLPLIASLQFYGGFPIRVITAFVSSQILNLFGYEVVPQGTLLYWLGEVIAVDAPCAGIKMMWTGLYLNFTLAVWQNLGFVSTWLSTSFTLFSVFVGNIFRATLLFFTESGLLNAPEIAHQAIGIMVFSMVALAVFSFHRSFYRRFYPTKREQILCAQ